MDINQNLNLKHYPYPSIGQFKNLIYNVSNKTCYIGKDENGEPMYDTLKIKPKLKFVGTTKLHGTNAGVILDFRNNQVYYQSREHVISPIKDNNGFALYMSAIQNEFIAFIKHYFNCENKIVAVYGEWCGKSIQKGVAISQLPRMFVIFDVAYIDPETGKKEYFPWEIIKTLENNPETRIFNIYSFPYWTIDIDFQYPELSQNKLVEITTEVENECPVAHQLGVDGIGEGVVWKCTTPGFEDSGFWMKVKGEKHSSSKTKGIIALNTEEVENTKEFVENTVTESRCIQSLSKLKEVGKSLDRSSLRDYLKWIVTDIHKEEMDVIIKNNIDVKKLNACIATKAREWFLINEINFEKLI